MNKKSILTALFLAFGTVECAQSPRGRHIPHYKFTAEDDQSLREAVAKMGAGNWNQIAAAMPGRNARQVRERWINYLAPDVNIEPYTPAEDALLLEKCRELGPKWFRIANFFSGRTDVSVKNRWNTLSHRNRREQKQATKEPAAAEPRQESLAEQAQSDAAAGDPTALVIQSAEDNYWDASSNFLDFDWDFNWNSDYWGPGEFPW
jgi:hypothetical protein